MTAKALSHLEFGHYPDLVAGLSPFTAADWQPTSCAIQRFEGRHFALPKKKPDTHFKVVTVVDAASTPVARPTLRVRSIPRAQPLPAGPAAWL